MKDSNKRRLSNSLLFPIVLILAGIGLPCVASAQDTTPPEIVEFSFSPTIIDVSTGAQNVTVTARVVDSLSGFDFGQLTFVSPSQAQHQPGFFNASHRISGNANDGIYRFTITFPQFAEAGIWTAGGCCSSLSDVVGNDRFFGEAYLAALGFPTELQVGEPQVSIADVMISEGNSGLTNAVFTVSLSFPSLEQVTVQFATAAGTANASSDFVVTSGTLTFAPGVTQQTVTVPVRGERRFEPNETFFVNLSSPTNATLSDAQGQGAILNDDRPRP